MSPSDEYDGRKWETRKIPKILEQYSHEESSLCQQTFNTFH